MKKISVIGSGTMGNGIAHCFAQKGFEVSLVDISIENLENAKIKISENLERLVKKDKISNLDMERTLSKISFYSDMKNCVNNCDLIIEAATESKKIKLNIFKELDSICKSEAILASNTSSISITEIALSTKRPDKIIGMHFMNPVPIMKLVEVIKGKQTSKKTFDTIMDLSKNLIKFLYL